MIRFGVNPICWSNDDDPNLGGEIPLEDCLSEAQQVGFEGIELGNKMPRTATELGAVLAKYNLKFVTAFWGMGLLNRSVKEEIIAYDEYKKLLTGLGCEIAIVCETSNSIHSNPNISISKRPRLNTEDYPSYLKKVDEFAKYLEDIGLRLAYHPHQGTAILTMQEIERFFDGTSDKVNMAFDSGHIFWGGSDPAYIAKKYLDRIIHIHLKDVRENVRLEIEQNDTSFMTAVAKGVFTVPGDGVIDFKSIFANFNNYKGWLIIEAEQDPKLANPLEYTTKGLKNIKKYLQESSQG